MDLFLIDRIFLDQRKNFVTQSLHGVVHIKSLQFVKINPKVWQTEKQTCIIMHYSVYRSATLLVMDNQYIIDFVHFGIDLISKLIPHTLFKSAIWEPFGNCWLSRYVH